MKKLLAALAFLALAVPCAAQYSSNYTDDTITGDLTVSGSITAGGAITGGGILGVPNGAVGAPSLYFTTDTNTGFYHDANHEINLASNGTEIGMFSYNGTTTYFAMYNGADSGSTAWYYQGGSTSNQIKLSDIGSSAIASTWAVTATAVGLSFVAPSPGTANVSFYSDDATGSYIRFGNAAATKYVDLVGPASAAGTKAINIPDTAGSMFVSTLTTNAPDAAQSVWAKDNGLVFGGQTGGDSVELILEPNGDPTSTDKTIYLPVAGNSAMFLSTLTTNDFDVVNSVWGASNGLVFEGATDDAFETTLTVTDPTADRTFTIPDATGTAFLSTLSTNAPDVTQSVWGVSNGITFEGEEADANETGIYPIEPVADHSFYLPAPAAGTSTFFTADNETNVEQGANSVWATANGFVFEGATADDYEINLTAADATTADKTITLPNLTGTVLLGGASNTHTGTTAIDADTALTLTSDGTITISAPKTYVLDGPLSLQDNDATGAQLQMQSDSGNVYKTLTDATAVVIGSYDASTAESWGAGIFSWGALARDATNDQVSSGTANVSWVNNAGTVTCTATEAGESVATDGGTLDCTPDCNVSSTTIQLRISCDTSLTTSTFQGHGSYTHTYGSVTPTITWGNDGGA